MEGDRGSAKHVAVGLRSVYIVRRPDRRNTQSVECNHIKKYNRKAGNASKGTKKILKNYFFCNFLKPPSLYISVKGKTKALKVKTQKGMEDFNMKKRIITTLLVAVLGLSSGITAFAAPKTMPDGNVFDAEYYAKTYADVKEALL